MQIILDLSNLNTERFFIIGDLRGEYEKLINILYDQNFSYKDTLITTGNNIDKDINKSYECLLFLKNMDNVYSVKGKREFDYINLNTEDKPSWIENEDGIDLIKFMEEMPLIIKINENLYVVSSGVEPGKSIEEQDPEVFYNISEYDQDSRFYQFENPEKKSWYDFEFFNEDRLIKFCFGGYGTGQVKHPAGYDLGRSINSNSIKSIIIPKGENESPILIEQ